MFRLKPLGEVTCFLKEDFRNEVVIITTGNAFKCNGMLLAARSSLITRMLSNKEISRPIVIPHSVPQIDVCLRLVYGGCVIVDWNNYTSIFIFGLFLQMVEFVLGVFRWVSNQTSDAIFWSVFCFTCSRLRCTFLSSPKLVYIGELYFSVILFSALPNLFT